MVEDKIGPKARAVDLRLMQINHRARPVLYSVVNDGVRPLVQVSIRIPDSIVDGLR